MKASSPDINWALKKKGTLQGMLEALERRAIEITLAAHDGNKTKAALDLGLSRLGLRKKISRYGLDRDLNTQ
jgi:two-component system response regulator HupR/HoxA